MGFHETVGITDAVFVEMQEVERDAALKFAARTLENLQFVLEVWQDHRDRHATPPVRLVTQTINSLLGLVVFTVEREFVRSVVTESVASLAARGWPKWKFELTASDNDSLGELAYHLRNGVSHARVRFSSDSADPAQVTITIEDAPSKKPVNWRAIITADDLLKFCFLYGQHVNDVIG
jgi:hypothetical protein